MPGEDFDDFPTPVDLIRPGLHQLEAELEMAQATADDLRRELAKAQLEIDRMRRELDELRQKLPNP